MGGPRAPCLLEPQGLSSGTTTHCARALGGRESGPPSFQAQPCCFRASELGQVSSPLCALVSSLKQGALCEGNMEYVKSLAWHLVGGNCPRSSSYCYNHDYHHCHHHHLLCLTCPGPQRSTICSCQLQAYAPQACGAHCPTGCGPPLMEDTINRLPGHWAQPSFTFIHFPIFPRQQEPREHHWQGGAPRWQPSPLSSSGYSRLPEPQPAFWPTWCPVAPTAAGLASFVVLATGPKHRVTFRPLLNLFSLNREHPNSTNYPTFYSEHYSHCPQNTSASLLREASPPTHTPAHTTSEHPFASCSPYISGLSIDIASSGSLP